MQIIFDRASHPRLADVPLAEAADQRRENFCERFGVGRKIDEEKALPAGKRHWFERPLRLIEALDFLHVARGRQRSVQAIGPGVVWARDGTRKLALRLSADARAAMPADLVEGAHFCISSAHDYDGVVSTVGQKIVAGCGDLLFATDAQPMSRKDMLGLAAKNGVGGVVFAR